MNYNLSYDIAAVAILACILAVHRISKSSVILQSKAFTFMAASAMLAGIFDILDVYSSANPQCFAMSFEHFTSMGYFVFTNTAPFGYAFYTVSLKKNSISSFKKWELIALFVPITILYLVILFNPLTHYVYYYDAQRIYHQGSRQFVLYTISLYYMIFGAIYTTINKKTLSQTHRVSVYLFIVIGFGASVVQLFLDSVYITAFGMAICILIILLAIQKPEDELDPKTGIFNSMTFDRIFKLHIASKTKGTLLLIYIEDIPLMSQAIGVDRVDGYLSAVGKYLFRLSEKQAFYIGVDYFAVLIDSEDDNVINEFVDSVHKRFENAWSFDGQTIYMSCRILQLSIPREVDSIESVAVYSEYFKDNHKYEFLVRAEDTSLAVTRRKLDVEAALKRGIENNGFEVYYQPIYSTRQKKIISAEALVRLYDPILGAIGPDEFIVIAEKNGTILKIGDIIFEKVCSFISENNLAEMGLSYIEVNMSVIQCLQETIADRLLKIMEKYGIEPKQINLEITETAAANSPKMLLKNMELLSAKGISFSLDDFGTGYSNMAAIMNLPLDIIKLDKSMIDTISSPNGNIVFLSSVSMIKDMNMKIVAEGIETKEQASQMEAVGIEYIQGYYFSKPLPEEKFLEYIKDYNK